MNYEPHFFAPQGVIKLKFSREDLLPLINEIESILIDESSAEKANPYLISHIKKSYILEKSKDTIGKLVIPAVDTFAQNFGFPKYISSILTSDVPYELADLWVNFQQKYEFTPLHDHLGIFSFVIWIKSPSYFEQEKQVFQEIPGYCKSGSLELIYRNMYGFDNTETFFMDKSFEGSGLLFPSTVQHCVYPFYSSNDYRISVAGNIRFKVK